MSEPTPAHLEPTWFIDSDSDAVGSFVDTTLGGTDRGDATRVAIALFEAVRDGIRYNPYVFGTTPDDYRASTVAGSPENWCTPKAVLLTASARRVGIPARLGFADVRNHLTSAKLSERMGTDLFAWHGYSELWLGDRWFKLSSAFNIELCDRFGVKVLHFDGTDDALMHPFDQSGERHMEYVNQRGSFDDLPLADIRADFARIYPDWIEEIQTGHAGSADGSDDEFTRTD